MILYDDKTENVITTGSQLLYPNIDHSEDVTFQASYIISGDLHCTGKVSALFDLTVLGDVTAKELDIKGRFVCMGRCNISGTITVQNDIWAEDIQARSIICHDRIVAQSIDADTVISDANIIIGKTLAVTEKAQTCQNVICGETAYGAGKIIASSILTAEPLDLDDGEDALESPFQYAPQSDPNSNTELSKESAKYALNNDYSGFLADLMRIPDKAMQARFGHYLAVLKAVEMSYPDSVSDFKDTSLLIWLIDLSNSDYFKNWPKITEWTESILSHFQDMAEGKNAGLHDPKPATKLDKGYTIVHSTYGRGIVRSILKMIIDGKMTHTAVVDFESYGEKKFPLPGSLSYFSVLSECETPSTEEVRSSIQCNINGYSEWLSALQLINSHKDYLGSSLYNIIYGLLLSKLGLKAKFVEDRFKEKGWK